MTAGTTFALLGPNGAGKTTTVHILSTLLAADEGVVRVAGHDVARELMPCAADRRDRAVLRGTLLTGEENLTLMVDLPTSIVPRVDGGSPASSSGSTLVDAAWPTAVTYSGVCGGRLDLRMTLIGEPRIIFLDEPTTDSTRAAVAPSGGSSGELVAEGVTTFLTSHYLEEADELADRRGARPRAADREGTRRAEDHPRRVRPPGARELRTLALAAAAFPVGTRDEDALTLQIPSDGAADSLRGVLDRLDAASIDVERVSVHTPDLDEVFLTPTGGVLMRTGRRSDRAPPRT